VGANEMKVPLEHRKEDEAGTPFMLSASALLGKSKGNGPNGLR
jgi:hypothetical protein